MHKHNRTHRNTVGGVASFILLVIGILLFFGLYNGFHNVWYFPFPTVAIIIVILLLSGVLRSNRRRVRHRPSYQNEYEKREIYKPTPNLYLKELENDKVTTQEVEERVVSDTNFCDYCGMKLNQEMKYCTNCGNRLN
ncbi:MAG: zinc ribbon domain-containing protein [Candidatus Heimdallarchaeaceae archaeon]|jgi:multisubunit Na+/H+ antiporter MnhG subunit